MTSVRYKLSDAVVALPDGRVLVTGGAPLAEVFEPLVGQFRAVPGDLGRVHSFATAVVLGDGSVLIGGGYDDQIHLDAGAWRYVAD